MGRRAGMTSRRPFPFAPSLLAMVRSGPPTALIFVTEFSALLYLSLICAADHRRTADIALYPKVRGFSRPDFRASFTGWRANAQMFPRFAIVSQRLTWVSRPRVGSARRWVLPSPMPTGPLFPALHSLSVICVAITADHRARHPCGETSRLTCRITAAKESGQGQIAALT